MKPPRQSRHVFANGIRLHYVRLGQGRPPLVLLPGITTPAAMWEFVGERLASRNDVYVLDNRGRGLSQGGSGLAYGLDDYAADTAGLIQALGLDRPAVVGHSMGARIAVRLAKRCPAAIGKLVLADPPVSGPGRRPYPMPLKFYIDSWRQVSRGQGYDEMKDGLPWSDEQLELRMEWLPTCDLTGIIESYESFHEEDIHSDLPGLVAETLLIYAEKGGTVSESDADEIVELVKKSRKQRIDGAGHMIPWDQLDRFIDAVQAFLAN
ncbi:MAG: alpha/beta hydrolase [Mesorhizobium sp.]|nr:MAG: alpha/beta hydrolase [Mesorhizobium sp.]TIX73418.1 MAG: alpha/beta hydrolase [Mesorhizobium sp.]